MRETVSCLAEAAGVVWRRRDDCVLAVNELVTNSLLHGGGRGRLRIWADPDAFVCEVHDAGRIDDPLVGRRAPRPGCEHGRGLWIVHHLCDLTQIRSSPTAGTTVRITTWL
ncbi:MAG: ATP-binding protein [Nocardioidaceae bacterium]